MSSNDKIVKITLPTPYMSNEVNVFLLKGETITLVDAGQNIEGAWDSLKGQLKLHGYKVKDIKQIIITHHHGDHIGLVKYFDHDVTFIGHPHCERWVNPTPAFLEFHDSFYYELFNQLGAPANIVKPYLNFISGLIVSNTQRSLDFKIEEGIEIPGLSEWKIINTFGHSKGHISLFNPEDQTLIGGDILLPFISPCPDIEPPFQKCGERPKPQLEINETLHRLMEMPIRKVLPGHGEDIFNPGEIIKLRLKKQHERAMQVRDLLMREPMTAYELSKHIFPKSYRTRFVFTLFEIVGQLDYLCSLELIKAERNDAGLVYKVK